MGSAVLAALLPFAVAQGGLVRPTPPAHRPVYVKVAASLPCQEVALGVMLLVARPQLAKCAAGKMGSAIFVVQTGPSGGRVAASEGSLSAVVRTCMRKKVLSKQPWPKDKCALKVTVRTD